MKLGNLLGKCLDQRSFECVDFHGLSQITREIIAEREAEIHNPPWQTEKDNALAKCRLSLRAWRTKKPMLCLHAVTHEDGRPRDGEDELGMRLCSTWGEIFGARAEGDQHHCHETILGYVQKAPNDIQWEINKHEFDEMIATKNESAPGPDGIPFSIDSCAGGLESLFLFDVYKSVCLRVVLSLHT